jgi:hypothetical protein
MSKTDQFWQYAKEAILSACYAQTDEDKQGLFDLARTWTQAALLERASSTHHDSPAEAGAAQGRSHVAASFFVLGRQTPPF